MAHAQKPDFVFRAKRTSPFKSARWGRQFSRLLASQGVRISGSNAGCKVFRGSVMGTGYPLHSPVSLPLPLPCVITFQLYSTPHVPSLSHLQEYLSKSSQLFLLHFSRFWSRKFESRTVGIY